MSPVVRAERRRRRQRLTALALAAAAAVGLTIQLRAGVVASVSPAGTSPGLTVAITGTGFNTTASKNQITFKVGAQPELLANATSIATVDPTSGLRRLQVIVPAGLPAGAATIQVKNTATGETSTGKTLQIIQLQLPDVHSGLPGTTNLAVRITGTPNVQFVANGTRVAIGSDITVSSVAVESPTSAVAIVTIPASAPPGPRTVSTITGTQTGQILNGFTVAAPNQPPVADTGGPYRGTAEEAIAFDGSHSLDPDGDTLAFAWDFGDGGTASGAKPQHVYASSGTFTVKLTVDDGRGGSAQQATTAIVAARNHAPQADAGGPYSGVAGQAVSLSGTASSDPDGDTLTYTWDFGDGSSATGASTSHVFSAEGAYSGLLTVDDGHGGTSHAGFSVAVSAPALGHGIIAGRVLDDLSGAPIAGARATLLSVNGSPAATPPAVTDALGRFRIPAEPGSARISLASDGYTGAVRLAAVTDGQRVDVLDARLTPLDARLNVIAAPAGGSATSAAGHARVTVAAAAIAGDATLRLTELSAQGLLAPLPLGWSPLAAVDVAPAVLAFAPAATARIAATVPLNATVVVAVWDGVSGTWISAGTGTRVDGQIETSIIHGGQIVIAMADAVPSPGSTPAAGVPLPGLAPRPLPDVQVTLTPTPHILFARTGAKARVVASLLPTAPLPSGTLIDVEAVETYTLTDGGVLRLAPQHRHVMAYQTGGSAGLISVFPVSPSRLFGPSLQQGTVDLAVRLPATAFAPHGRVFAASGGDALGPSGEHLIVPAGAADDVPVDLETIAPADVTVQLPTGFTLAGAVSIDLYGARFVSPASLTMPLPPGLTNPASAVLARAVEAGTSTRWVLIAAATVKDGALVSTIDPYGDGSIQLPGVLDEGRYAFLISTSPLGYQSGVVTGAGAAPLDGALVLPAPGLGAIADVQGRYAIAGPLGVSQVSTFNFVSGDVQQTSVTFTAAPTSNGAIAIGASAPVVTSISPAAGVRGVARAATVTVTFSRPIDPASIGSDGIHLDGAQRVVGSFILAAGGRSGTFRPAALLDSAATYVLTVSPVLRDTSGRPLASGVTSAFTTVDTTPPPAPAAGAVTASIPDASGTSTVTGSQGSADPDGLVLIRNLRTGAITTLSPRSDGSFTGIVAALRTDHLELTLKSAAGNATTVPVAPFTGADGSVVIGSAGGVLRGPAGITVEIPAGAVADGTVARIDLVSPDALPAPVPARFVLAQALRLDLGGAPVAAELRVSVAAPQGASADQIVVAKAVPFGTATSWTVVERAKFADGRYTTMSPPFTGVISQGTFLFLRASDDCVSYVSVKFSLRFHAYFASDGLGAFVFPTLDSSQATVPQSCGAQLNLSIVDPNTVETLRQVSFFAPAARDDIAFPPDPITDDDTPPSVLSVNNPTDQAVAQIEVRFTKALDPATIAANVRVRDSSGNEVAGATQILDGGTHIIFTPSTPFRQGQQYTFLLAGVTDTAGNVIDTPMVTFTPYGPRSISVLQQFPAVCPGDASLPCLKQALLKCGASAGGCTTSSPDVTVIGSTLFIANGLRNASEQYQDPAHPQRLLAVDITDPFKPSLIGWAATTTNPLVVSGVHTASLLVPSATTPLFTGDVLLVAGGGRVAGGELDAKLEVWDASACTRRPVLTNCLDNRLKGFKLLSTAAGSAPKPGVPPDSGVPLQMAVLHQVLQGPGADVLVAYVLVSAIGVEAVDVPSAFNLGVQDQSALGPVGVLAGDYSDVGVLKNRVVAVGLDSATGTNRIDVLTGQLGRVARIPPPLPSGLSGFTGAARVGIAENLVFDLDGDGRVGIDEDNDGDPQTGAGELFDLALVSSGAISDGCVSVAPCGEIYVVDLSAQTDLSHPGGARILDRIQVPGPAFSIAVDAQSRLAYVELRGRGIATLDLSYLLPLLRGHPAAQGVVDANHDGIDDRVISVLPTGRGQQDLVTTHLKIDVNRGLAFVNGAAEGLEIVQVANRADELSLDFRDNPRTDVPRFADEKHTLQDLLDAAVTYVRDRIPGIAISALEQGSGSCFWRVPGFDEGLLADECRTFQPGLSDHDIEVFVPQANVERVQQELNNFIASKPTGLSDLADLSLYAMPREPLQNAELLVGTPLYGDGVSDATGDLGMGRQTLLLLWLLEGEYITGHQEGLPDLSSLLDTLKSKATQSSVIPGQPSIPILEGQEWAVLQEYNVYKTGALLRVRGGCEADQMLAPRRAALRDDGNNPDVNFTGDSVLKHDCQEELHTIAKAAIRAVLARLIGNPLTNPLVLDIDPDHTGDDRSAYRHTACFDGPFTDGAADYVRVGCSGFEHFIASTAVRAAQRGLMFTSPDELQQVYRFYCVKIDCDASLVTTDQQADGFVREALTFIETVERETRDAYAQTVRLDTKTIGSIPNLLAGPGGGPGIAAICSAALAAHSSLIDGFRGTSNDPIPSAIDAGTARKWLRLCNYVILSVKIHGDDTITATANSQYLQLNSNNAALNEVKKRLGVSRAVDWNLRVRAWNRGGRQVNVGLTLYAGDGTDSRHYSTLESLPLVLDPAEQRIVYDEPVPNRPQGSTKTQPIFPLLFDLTQPALQPGQVGALTFYLDPERTVPEADRHDNQASFFYYVLDRSASGPPSTPSDAVAPVDNVDPDPLAIAQPRLAFDFTVAGRAGSGFVGAKQIQVGIGEAVNLKYAVRNLGPVAVHDVQIVRNRRVVLAIPELGAAGASNDHITIQDPQPFVPTDSGLFVLRALVTGFDAKGNSIPVLDDVVSVTASDDLSSARVRFFDASPLAAQDHPFSRFTTNLDSAGRDVPLHGAVTDGDAAGGGARMRVDIDRLTPGAQVSISLKDPEIPGAADDLGWLEVGTDLALQSTTVTADGGGRVTLFYRPPAVFVRDLHRAIDVAKLERTVKLLVLQPGGVGGAGTVTLRRPPVILLHGLFSNTDTWNQMQPLVPAPGMTAGFTPTAGFDGRFDLIALGSPHMSGSIASEVAVLKDQLHIALSNQFEGFAIGRVDIIAHSMGALVARQLANDFVNSTASWGGTIKLPIRKIIAIDAPFAGSVLADKIAQIRDQLPVKVSIDVPKDYLDVVTSTTGGDTPTISPEVAVKAKLETCALLIQSVGLTPAFFLKGALDDLRTGSAAVTQISANPIPVPSHHIVGTTVPPELGISADMTALWSTLGYFCNLTPDSTTTEATVLVQVGVEAASLLIPGNLRALKPKTSLSLGSNFEVAEISQNTRSFLSRVGPVAQFAKKEASGPTPVFAVANDRTITDGGQLGGLTTGSTAVTTVDGRLDHNTVLRSPLVPPSACSGLDATTPPQVRDLNGDGTPDLACRVIYLLEAAPSSPLFVRSGGQ